MRALRFLTGLLIAVALTGCATAYEPQGFSGGFQEKDLGAGAWRVIFAANGYTTQETTQTYWLYRCASLALEHGYDGFRLVTKVNLAAAGAALNPGKGEIIRVKGGGGGTYVYVYGGGGGGMIKPVIQGDIQLIKRPFEERTMVVFDAHKLSAALEPLVKGPKNCNGNVCPHAHTYLYPTAPPAP